MKRKNVFNLLGFFMLIACAILGVGDLGGTIYAAGAVTDVTNADGEKVATAINHTGVQGLDTQTTRTHAEDLIVDPVDANIVKMRPTLAPLDTIMRYATAKKSTTQEFSWYTTDIRPVKSEILSFAKTASTIAPNQYGAIITVDNANLYAVSDTITVPGIYGTNANTGKTCASDLMLYVYEVDNSGRLYVTCESSNGDLDAQGDYTVPTIANGTIVYRMARAAYEGDVVTNATSILPTKATGYCQIFKCQLSQSTLHKMAEKEVKWDNEIEEQAMYEFRLAMEASFLFGVQGKIFDPKKNGLVYTTGGIANSVKNVYQLRDSRVQGAAANTNADLVAMTKAIFQGNAGAKSRVLFAGSGLTEVLSNIETVQKQVDAGNTLVQWGIEWKTIKTNFGTLMLMQHDLFDEYGWSDKGLVLDPQFIDKWTVKGMERLQLDTIKSGQYDGDVTVFTEISGLALKYPSCHMRIELV